jgi:hypothetical protein
MKKTLILAAALSLTTGAAAFAGSQSASDGSQRLSMIGMPGSHSNMSSSTSRIPSFADPHTPGATGRTVVLGDPSTIAGDRAATRDEQTGAYSPD